MATFGNTSIGGTTTGDNTNITGCKFTAPENGTITSLSVYNSSGLGTPAIGCAIYSDNAGSPNVKLAEDSGNGASSGTPSWRQINISLAVTAGTVYWLCFWTTGVGGNYRYDAGSANQAFIKSATFETWTDPMVTPTFQSRNYSFYATYTPDATTSTSITTSTSTTSTSSSTSTSTTSTSTSTTTSTSTSTTSTSTTSTSTSSSTSTTSTSTSTSRTTSTSTTSTSTSTTISITTSTSTTSTSSTTSISTSTSSSTTMTIPYAFVVGKLKQKRISETGEVVNFKIEKIGN